MHISTGVFPRVRSVVVLILLFLTTAYTVDVRGRRAVASAWEGQSVTLKQPLDVDAGPGQPSDVVLPQPYQPGAVLRVARVQVDADRVRVFFHRHDQVADETMLTVRPTVALANDPVDARTIDALLGQVLIRE